MKKIFDVDTLFPQLVCNETDYWKIIDFYRPFTKEFYDAHNIYCERHHIYPKGETKVEIEEFVWMPFKYHFLAHYYKALNASSELELRVNYNACKIMMGKRRSRKRFDMSLIKFSEYMYEARRENVQASAIKRSRRATKNQRRKSTRKRKQRFSNY